MIQGPRERSHASRDGNITFAEEVSCGIGCVVSAPLFSAREQIQGRKARHVLEGLASFLASGLRSESSRLLQSTLDGSDL
jgi:hypothetical protein